MMFLSIFIGGVSRKSIPEQPATPGTPGLKPLSQSYSTPIDDWVTTRKHFRDAAQLSHDMKVTTYLIKGSLPWNHVKSDAFVGFCKDTELRKYWIKAPTTYSKAKLPLLYNQVHEAVEAKMKKDLPGTLGFAFTADLWSSRYKINIKN